MLDTINKKKYLFNSIFFALNNTIVSALIAFIFIPLIINNIGVNAYGVWSLLAIFTGLAGLGDFGLSKAIVYFISNKKIGIKRNLFFSAALLLNVVIVTLVAVIILYFLYFDFTLFSNNPEINAKLDKYIIFIGGVSFISSIIIGFAKALMEASFRISLANNLSLLLTFLIYIPVYIASFFTVDLFLLVGLYGLANIIVLIIHVYLVFSKLSFKFIVPSRYLITKVFRYSLSFLTIGVINIILLPLCRYLIVTNSADGTAHAIFDVACKISLAATSILMSFCAPLYSLFSGFGIKNKQQVFTYVAGFSKKIFILFLVGNISFWFIGKHICELMLPEYHIDLFYVTSVMLFCISFTACAEPAVRAMWSFGQVFISAIIKLGLLFFNLLFIFLFLKLDPLYKYSLAYSIPFFIVSLLYLFHFFLFYKKNTVEELA